MYHGGAGGIFSDESYESGVAEISLPFVGFGTFFFDYDNNGLLDIFVANGHIIDNVHLFGTVSTYREPNLVFRNEGGGQFREVASSLGDALAVPNVARGAAPGDYDQDGDLDVLVTRCGGPALLVRNDGGNARPGITIDLVGRRSNRFGVGARATVRVGTTSAFAEVKTGMSYLSQGQLSLHFGLGESAAADTIEIRWPSGVLDRLERIQRGRLVILEGSGAL
jgi:hypothetical protein